MALTTLEQVRLGIGDSVAPYLLTDDQINHYLTVNSDNVDDTIDDLQPIIVSILARQAALTRAEDLWRDTTKTPQSYIDSVEQANKLRARANAYPIIGGTDSYKGNTIDQFDNENNWERTSGTTDYYNGYEDL